jgi:MYXO-CTERM domain-containing protein
VLASSSALAAKTNYKADLEGSSADSNATGTGNFTYDSDTKRLCGKVTFNALETGAVTGVALKNVDNRALVKTATPGPSPLTLNVTLTDAEAALLQNPGVYLGIGTAMHPAGAGADDNGEINGELLPDANGAEVPCGGATDAGVDSGSSDGGTSSSSSSSSGSPPDNSGNTSSSSGSSGDTTPPLTENSPPAKKDDGGCSSTGSASSGGVALAALAALVIAGRTRRRTSR